MFTDFEREVWRDALEVAHKKGYASRSRKEIIDRYWSDELEDDNYNYEYQEYLNLNKVVAI